MYGVLHPKGYVYILHVQRKEGGRGLISVERCVEEEGNSLGFYVSKSEENFIRGVIASETISTEDALMSGEFKKQKAQELKQNQCEKKMHGQFVKEMPDQVDKDKS